MTGRLWATLVDSTLKATTGQNRARWGILFTLQTETAPLTTMSLARILNVQWATVVRTVSALEEDGLVERIENPEDRRSSTLHLTPEGRRLTLQIPTYMDPVRRDILKDFDDQSLGNLVEMLGLIRGKISGTPE